MLCAGDRFSALNIIKMTSRFTPVSFWLLLRGDGVVAAIAEVNNTFGQRHSYLCLKPGFAPLTPGDTVRARKVFHVSPFQDVTGDYAFAFALSGERLAIRIAHENGAGDEPEGTLRAHEKNPEGPSGRLARNAARSVVGMLAVQNGLGNGGTSRSGINSPQRAQRTQRRGRSR